MSLTSALLGKRIFYLPAIVYLGIFSLFPFALSIYFSSPNGNLSSYVQLFQMQGITEVISNTVIFAIASAAVVTLLGGVLAIFVDGLRKGRRAFSLLSYLPYMIPLTASALIWMTIFDPIYGPLDSLLGALGLPKPNWMGAPALQLPSSIIVMVWAGIPLAFLIILAGLTSVPKAVKEAAAVDGMGSYDYYATLAVPLARRAFLTAFLLTAILAFGNFDLIYILSGAGGVPPPSIATLSVFAYSVFESGQVAESFAAVIILAALVSVLAFFFIRLYQGGGRTRVRLRIPRIPNRVFRFVIYAVSAATIAFILFPVYWMFLTAFRPQSLDFVSPAILLPTKITSTVFFQTAVAAVPYLVTTIAVSAVTMGITVFIAAPAAYSVSRHGKRWLLMLSIYLYSVPSTSFVFGAFFIFSRLGLLNTWEALMLSYPIFTIPFAIWTMSNFYADLPKHYEEAAQVDGYSPLRSFYEIVMPLARPGLFATALISFIISWHLLLFPVVLSQSPYQFNFPPVGSYTVTQFAANFDPRSVGASVSNNVWVQLASSGLILSVPVIILAVFTQEYIMKGLYSGGVKG